MAVFQEHVGKKAKTAHDIYLADGTICPKGTTVIIKRAFHGMWVESEPCPVCGKRFYINGLKKENLEIMEGEENAKI